MISSYGGASLPTALEVKSEEVSLPAAAGVLDLAAIVPPVVADLLSRPGAFDLAEEDVPSIRPGCVMHIHYDE